MKKIIVISVIVMLSSDMFAGARIVLHDTVPTGMVCPLDTAGKRPYFVMDGKKIPTDKASVRNYMSKVGMQYKIVSRYDNGKERTTKIIVK